MPLEFTVDTLLSLVVVVEALLRQPLPAALSPRVRLAAEWAHLFLWNEMKHGFAEDFRLTRTVSSS